jgi:hypothetical protein
VSQALDGEQLKHKNQLEQHVINGASCLKR